MGSAQPLEPMSVLDDRGRKVAQLVGARAVVGRGRHVLGGAAELEQPVLQVGEFRGGQYHRVLGQPAALDGGSAFVGALSARLGAVAAGAADLAVLWQAKTAPAAVPDGGAGLDSFRSDHLTNLTGLTLAGKGPSTHEPRR